MEGKDMNLPITSIKVNTPIRYDLGSIQSLAENIAEFGLLHPIVVTEESTKDEVQSTKAKSEIRNLPAEALAQAGPQSAITSSLVLRPSSFYYTLVAGYRRLKAAELLGWAEVPVSIISPADDLKQFDTSLHENFRRKDLNPLEICEVILERKHRWEKIYGPIKPGPQSSEGTTEVEFSSNGAKFNIETTKILHMSEPVIKRFLQLKDLDPDLRQQIEERKISYRTALSLQSERKKEQKQSKSGKMHSPNLPDREMALALQVEYSRSPVLFQIMFLVSHVYQTMLRNQGKQPEFETANPERLVQFIGQLSAVMSWLNDLMKETQDTLMKQTINNKS
jgi:ParB-like chromosome segregation protein Spo0J